MRVVVERHGIDDRLLQRIRILLTDDRDMRHQLAHIFADVVDRLVAASNLWERESDNGNTRRTARRNRT